MNRNFIHGDVVYEARLLSDEFHNGTVRFYPFHTTTGTERIIEVACPAAARPGDYVKISGVGSSAQDGCSYGDMYVRLVLWHDPAQIEGTFTGYRTKAAAQLAATQRR